MTLYTLFSFAFTILTCALLVDSFDRLLVDPRLQIFQSFLIKMLFMQTFAENLWICFELIFFLLYIRLICNLIVPLLHSWKGVTRVTTSQIRNNPWSCHIISALICLCKFSPSLYFHYFISYWIYHTGSTIFLRLFNTDLFIILINQQQGNIKTFYAKCSWLQFIASKNLLNLKWHMGISHLLFCDEAKQWTREFFFRPGRFRPFW